jgi:RimJ/RimL family protein N-acetyltransferase
MADLGPVAGWPPAPIRSQRLVVRQTQARDRDTVIELNASAEVRTYLGGPRDRDELARVLPEVPGLRPGFFAVELDGSMIGTVQHHRRDPERPGHVRAEGGEVELVYLFLPSAWGLGYAREACDAVLAWLAEALPDEPVVLCTQTANAPSVRLAARLGFVEVDRFEEFGAEQWFGVRWA